MEMSKMLTLSTAHVSEETGEWLNQQGLVIARRFQDRNTETTTVFMGSHDDGWFVHAPTHYEMDHEYPRDLLTVIMFARQHYVEYLNFDAGAGEVDGLPTFEW